LGLPQPIEVRANERGWPVAVKLNRRWATVTVEDRWRIDDEWWREEGTIRLYYRVTLNSTHVNILYYDLFSAMWFRQGLGAD
ncbi:MAG: hypothetical protein Q7R39_12480, partial [Dehalococcoidia bacterium]|nr:hypothetical protein [Dehalococcoidia bacterium]